MSDLASTIATLLEHGPDLRRAGYQSVTIGEVSFTLHPPELDYPEPPKTAEPPRDPLSDPTTYGLPEGATVPSFIDPRPKKKG